MPKKVIARSVLERFFAHTTDFPVVVISLRTQEGESYPFLYHRELEFHYIKKGRGTYFIKDRRHNFHRNTLLIVKPYEVHRLILQAGSQVEKLALEADPSILRVRQSVKFLIRKLPRHIELSEQEAAQVESLINRIHQERTRGDPFWKTIVHAELRILLNLIKRWSSKKVSVPEENPLLRQLMEFVEKHFQQKITLVSVARQFGYSPFYIAHIFRQHVGMGLKQYILQRRVAEARRLLQEQPALKVTSVASQVGFRQFASFNRCFKMFAKITPAAYRKILHSDRKV